MRNIILCAMLPFLSGMMGCSHVPGPAQVPVMRHTVEYQENLRWSLDKSIRKQEQEDKLDQLMWIK